MEVRPPRPQLPAARETPRICNADPRGSRDAVGTDYRDEWDHRRSADHGARTRPDRSNPVPGGTDDDGVGDDDGDWMTWCCSVHCYYGIHHFLTDLLGTVSKLQIKESTPVLCIYIKQWKKLIRIIQIHFYS